MEGSIWFQKFKREMKKLDPHLKLRRIKYGFYRIYWVSGGASAYIHEVYKEMPYKGYTFETDDYRLESLDLYEQYEDRAELTRKIKNFVEGYIDSMDKLKKRVYLLKNNNEFRKEAFAAYKEFKVK